MTDNGHSNIPVVLSHFEGPLDLLLYLVSKHEIDLRDIPIAQLTEQYIHSLKDIDALTPDQAGDFLVMAATLMHLKSRLLLPKEEQTNEDEPPMEDPRWELVEQLLEYRAFKARAEQLRKKSLEKEGLIPRQVAPPTFAREEIKLKKSHGMAVWGTFQHILQNLATRAQIGQLRHENLTISGQMRFLLSKLKRKSHQIFHRLFENIPHQWEKVTTTFLAVLELARLGELTLTQEKPHGPIHLRSKNKQTEN